MRMILTFTTLACEAVLTGPKEVRNLAAIYAITSVPEGPIG